VPSESKKEGRCGSTKEIILLTVKCFKLLCIKAGNYYILYENCEKHLKETFENKYGTPILYKNGIGQYDANNNLLKEFVCKYYCCKKLHISDKSLSRALAKNIAYDNHYYRYLGCKDKIV